MFLSELIPVEKAHKIIAENQKIMPLRIHISTQLSSL